MSIKRFIKKVCVQTIVYWEFDGVDGFHTPQFLDAVELKVRWDEKAEVITDRDGKEYVSNAQLLTPQDLVEQSYVYLGTLADLPASPNPLETEGAFEIVNMERYPTFRSQTFDVFIAFL
jgi:hypothetical protein